MFLIAGVILSPNRSSCSCSSQELLSSAHGKDDPTDQKNPEGTIPYTKNSANWTLPLRTALGEVADVKAVGVLVIYFLHI